MRRVILAVMALGGLARADVAVPTIFGDHMILQQDAKLPVWGSAEAGEKVKVTVGDKSAETTAGADGKWWVELAPIAGTSTPTTMTIVGKNTLSFSDVLIGEVWFCSGQSNMGFNLGKTADAATDVPKANDPLLRYFHVAASYEIEPSTKFACGKWELCTPEVAASYSGVAYYFGKNLRSSLNRPVALVISAWGGTAIESWTPLAAIKDDPYFKGDVDRYNQALADYPKLQAELPAKMKEWGEAMAEWNKNGGTQYANDLKAWNDANDAAKAAGQPPLTNKPNPPATPQPKQPSPANGGVGTWGSLYNGTVNVIIPYAIKGVIWYQGESNAGNPAKYAKMFPALINGWRTAWGEGNFPFIFVQLPGYIQGVNWPAFREVQAQALQLPNAAMVANIDLGEYNNIHPPHKATVGARLSTTARKLAYGETSLVASGPVYDSMKVEGSAIRVSFKELGSGLVIGAAPWVATGYDPLPTDRLLGFAIADDHNHWFPADAKIDGATVVVFSDKVTTPTAVRYAWMFAPACNLYNKEGLPAPPFRTDDSKDLSESPARDLQFLRTGPAMPKAVTPAPAPAVTSGSNTAK